MNPQDNKAVLEEFPWRLVIPGVFAYVMLGLVVQYIPNPIVPSAILALNMVVVVVSGYIGGARAGAAVGLLGTLSTFLLKLPMGTPDFYELGAVLPHTLMGLVAGWSRVQQSRLLSASTILVGHSLNILVFSLSGLLPWRVLTTEVFWNGIFAETTIGLILIIVTLGVYQNLTLTAPERPAQNLPQRRLVLTWSAILALTLILVLLFYGQVTLAPYLFALPVVLAAIYLGPLAAWVMALLLSFVLLGAASFAILEEASIIHEVSMILMLNLVALAVGELAEDLTAQRFLAQQRLLELEDAYVALSDADRIKSEMIQNISHELRTPLAIILGHTELLITGLLGRLTEEQTTSIAAAHKHARKLTYLVEQVTVLHQVDEGKLSWQTVALDVLVRAHVEHVRPAAQEKDCYLRVSLPENLPAFEGDPEYLGRAVTALLDNAIKFSAGQGGIIDVKGWADKGRVYLTISDEGIGIAQENHQRIFERFCQGDGSTTRRFGGLGTGLALVKEVVQAHGGDVWVESVVNLGSTFGLWIPITPPPDRQHLELSIYKQFAEQQETVNA